MKSRPGQDVSTSAVVQGSDPELAVNSRREKLALI